MPRQCLICKPFDYIANNFVRPSPTRLSGYCTWASITFFSNYYACETTVFLNEKYSNTTYISKI